MDNNLLQVSAVTDELHNAQHHGTLAAQKQRWSLSVINLWWFMYRSEKAENWLS